MECRLSAFVALELTLFGKYDTSKTVSIRLTNQPFLGDKPTIETFPCLLSVTGVGVQQDEFFPKNKTGNVVLNNTRDSIAFQKRITDLSSVYVLQGATAQLYVSCLREDRTITEADLELQWEGEVKSVNYSTNSTENTSKLQISLGKEDPEHIVTKVLRRDEFPELPDRSKGKYLPVVFGFNQQVQPYPLEEPKQQGVNGTKLTFAYATNMDGVGGNQFKNIGITNILAKDITSRDEEYAKYYPITSANDINTPVYQQITLGPVVGTAPDIAKARAFWIPYFPGFTTGLSYIVTGIRLFVQGNSSAAPEIEGELSIRIHRQRVNAQRPEPPSDSLSEAVVVKSDYLSQWVGGSIFAVDAVFREPVPIVGDGTYWISVQGSGENDANNVTLLPIIDANPGVVPGIVTHWSTTDDAIKDNNDTWIAETAFGPQQTTASFQLYGMVFGDFPDGDGSIDNDGLGYSYTDLRYQDFATSHPAGAQELEDLSRIDVLYEISGLRDVTGDITGVPDFILGNPTWQVEALLYEFDGTGWFPGKFNKTRFSSSHTQYIDITERFFRETAGRSYGKSTNIDILKELGKNSYSTITYDGIGGIAEYSILAVGHKRDAITRLTDDDAIFERWAVNDLSYVVNVLDMNYARRLDDIHFQTSLDQEQFRDYSKTLSTHPRDSDLGQEFSAKSFFHYGERRLDDENFNYVFSDVPAANVAELFLRLHDHPAEYAQVLVPFCGRKHDFRMLDVVELLSTELPAIHGTAAASSTPHDEDCDAAAFPISKARPIRAVVQAITLNYEERGQVFLRLLCRLVTQENDPIEDFIKLDYNVV